MSELSILVWGIFGEYLTTEVGGIYIYFHALFDMLKNACGNSQMKNDSFPFRIITASSVLKGEGWEYRIKEWVSWIEI